MPDRDPAPSAADTCASIIWMGHLIERFANTRLPAAGFPPEISFARANVLFAVHAARQQGGSSRMVDIALDLGVTARTLTTMVDALERLDLLRREPDPDDRRAIQLALTAQGQSLIEPLASAVEAASDVILGPLDNDERGTLSRLMTKLIERDG